MALPDMPFLKSALIGTLSMTAGNLCIFGARSIIGICFMRKIGKPDFITYGGLIASAWLMAVLLADGLNGVEKRKTTKHRTAGCSTHRAPGIRTRCPACDHNL